MAFPGGRAEVADASARETAAREAKEEVGLHLEGVEFLGGLDALHAGRTRQLLLAPYLWYAGTKAPALIPNAFEVARTFWIPTEHLWAPQHETTIEYRHEGGVGRFPGVGYDGEVVWGLTLRILRQLGDGLGMPLIPGR